MSWKRQCVYLSVLSAGMAVIVGCGSLPDYARPTQSLAQDLTTQPEARVARLQRADGPPPLSLPPIDPKGIMPPPPVAQPKSSVQQAGLVSRGVVRVEVRVWVNGVPIFDDEVMQMAAPELQRFKDTRGSVAAQKQAEVIEKTIESMIDQEVLHQHAIKMLEKSGNPNAVKQLKKAVDHEFDKMLRRWTESKIPEATIKEMEPVYRRILERSLVSSEFARAQIVDRVKTSITLEAIREYYEEHKNEFQTVDRIEWQNIFIPTSANLPTVADVKRFAEGQIANCRKPDDFNKLMVYNEGATRLSGGAGLGDRVGHRDSKTGEWVPGNIRPAELDEPLSQLREGQIGPAIPFPTGVHLMHVVKREYANQQPLDDKVQTAIRKKLEQELLDRELKRVQREMRSRAIVRYEHAVR